MKLQVVKTRREMAWHAFAVAVLFCFAGNAVETSFATVYDPATCGLRVGGDARANTVALQRAIDAASRAGGGEVRISPGVYECGSVWLKDNVDLHLGPGAVLKGTSDPSLYCASNCCPQNYASPREGDNTSGGHLLLAVGVKNVTVRGPGCIDGNSAVFLLDEKGILIKQRDIPFRPAQMVWFCDSTDIRLTDLELANAPYWSCFLLNCDRVQVRGCYVHTERRTFHTYNGDGIDVDRCRWVTISDCRIDTSDDCITLRASGAKRLAEPHDCAYVTVVNCNLSSSCNAIRPGVGEGRIHDAVLGNLTISDTRNAFNIVSAYSRTSRGPDITDIRFHDIRIEARNFGRIHHLFSKDALFRNIVFDGLSGKTEDPFVPVYAHPNRPFEKLVFRNVDLACELEAVNADVRIEGGTVTQRPLSPDDVKRLNEDIVTGRRHFW